MVINKSLKWDLNAIYPFLRSLSFDIHHFPPRNFEDNLKSLKNLAEIFVTEANVIVEYSMMVLPINKMKLSISFFFKSKIFIGDSLVPEAHVKVYFTTPHPTFNSGQPFHPALYKVGWKHLLSYPLLRVVNSYFMNGESKKADPAFNDYIK